jgi:hypothetical protein
MTKRCVECLEPMWSCDSGDTCTECREYFTNEQQQYEEDMEDYYKAIVGLDDND